MGWLFLATYIFFIILVIFVLELPKLPFLFYLNQKFPPKFLPLSSPDTNQIFAFYVSKSYMLSLSLSLSLSLKTRSVTFVFKNLLNPATTATATATSISTSLFVKISFVKNQIESQKQLQSLQIEQWKRSSAPSQHLSSLAGGIAVQVVYFRLAGRRTQWPVWSSSNSWATTF